MSTYVFPRKIEIYAYPSGSPVLLSPSDVIDTISIKRGFLNQKPDTRISSPGQLTFNLLNNEYNSVHTPNYYTPSHANALSGWQKGIACELMIHYGSTTDNPDDSVCKFYGWITSIKVNYIDGTVEVTCNDNMYYLSRLATPDITPQFYSTVYDRSVALTTSCTPSLQLYPLSGSSGFLSFPSIGEAENTSDSISKTLNELITNEPGYIYSVPAPGYNLGWDYRTYIESKDYRGPDITGSQIPLHENFSGKILTESGDYLQTESGDYLVLNEVEPSIINDEHQDASYSDGLIVNKIITNFTTVTDNNTIINLGKSSNVEYLYQNTPHPIKIYYSDVDNQGYDYISGKSASLINLVVSSGSETGSGSGLNRTANVTVTSVVNNVDYATVTINNTSASFVLWVQPGATITGCAVTRETFWPNIPIENTASEEANSIISANLPMIYWDYGSGTVQLGLLGKLLTHYANPRLTIDKLSFMGNTSQHLMLLAMYLDIGSQIRVIDSKIGIDDFYYIDYVEMTIEGNLIDVTWTLREYVILT